MNEAARRVLQRHQPVVVIDERRIQRATLDPPDEPEIPSVSNLDPGRPEGGQQ